MMLIWGILVEFEYFLIWDADDTDGADFSLIFFWNDSVLFYGTRMTLISQIFLESFDE